MQISAIGTYYRNNLNNRYLEKALKTEPKDTTETQDTTTVAFGGVGDKVGNKLKTLILATMVAASALVLSNCTKEPQGPHPSGYVRPEEPVVSHDGYPEDAPEEVRQEFIEWYQDNCPYYYWPDYTSPYPEGWEQEVQEFQNAIIEWWRSHGYPDWHP